MASPSLLDRVQERPDVEGQIRQLRRQRLKEHGSGVYIQPQAIANLQAREDTRFPLMEKVEQFLESDRKVFLLLGESGAGKSTFNRELEHQLWEAYEKGGGIPLHINLPAMDKPEHDMIAKQLRKNEFTESQIGELKLHRKFTLICDGYDESQQIRNLYSTNRLNQPGEWNAKMVISCRSEYVGSDYRDRFQPGDRNSRADPVLFQEAVITPFSKDQIQDYIAQYVSVHRPLWKADEYNMTMEHIPSLKELMANPFLMSLSLEVLPRMVDPGQNLSATHITRVSLYDRFIEHWLERGKKRLGEKDMGPLARAAFEGLVDEGFTRSGIDYLKRLSAAIYKEQDGHPIVRYSRYDDKGSWKTEFFSRDDETQLLREACPLVRNSNQYRFIHRSLLEYGLSLAVYDPLIRKEQMEPEFNSARRGSVSSVLSYEDDPVDVVSVTVQQEPDLNSPLAWKYFTKEPSVLHFLEERAQQEPLFKRRLLDYIAYSKTDKKWRIASSNAITILVRSGVQFNGADLRGVRIPRADISNGMFDSAQLQGANLRQVDLRGVWLKRANLKNAEMTDTQLGAPPYLECEDMVQRCLYSPDGSSITLVTFQDIQVYSTSTWGRMWAMDRRECYASVVYSPRGDRLAFSHSGYTVVIWNILTGDREHILYGHTNNVTDVAYSPQGDQVASASKDASVKLWDVETGDCLHTLTGHTDRVRCIAYSPYGSQIASGSDDRTVRLWDVKTGKRNHIPLRHDGSISKVVYSPQGDRVASSYDYGYEDRIQLWDVVHEPRDCPSAIPTGIRADRLLVCSPKGDQVASTKGDDILLWDVKTEKLLHTLVSYGKWATQIVYSHRGDLVASTSFSNAIVRLWDAETGVCLRLLAGHSKEICSVVFSPKGDRIISSSLDKTVRIWDAGVRTSQRTSSSHIEVVYMVKCSPNGDQVASCSKDMTVRLWDVETGSCRHILRGHNKDVRCIAYSPEGDQIATGSDDTTVRLWDTETGSCTHTLTDHSKTVYEIVYSPQKDRVASCSHDGTVLLWNVRSGECLRTLCSGVQSAALSPNWGRFATVNRVKVQLRDVGTGGCTGELHRADFDRMIWSSQGDHIAAVHQWGSMALWRIKNSKQDDGKNQAGNENDIDNGDDDEMDDDYVDDGENDDDYEDDGSNGSGSVLYNGLNCELAVFSPDGSQIACDHSRYHGIDADHTVHLFDTMTGRQLWASKGHTQKITRIVYSSRGDLMVSASEDQTVRLWDAVSGQCRAVIRDFQHKVSNIAWVETPNAKYVVAGCWDGVVGMWQVIMDEDQCQVRLHWKKTNGMFDVQDATIQGVKGLDSLNKRILKQSGAVGEPAHREREGSKEEATVAPVVSKFKDPSDGAEAINDLTNRSAKRLLEFGEEDEDVAKRMRGNERGSRMEE